MFIFRYKKTKSQASERRLGRSSIDMDHVATVYGHVGGAPSSTQHPALSDLYKP